MKIKNHALIVASTSIVLFAFAAQVEAQYKSTTEGGITASPKVQSMLGIKTKAEADALKPGDTIAMVCIKCKSVMVRNVTTEKGHVKVMTVGEKHLCPGCNTYIKVVGEGKHGPKDEVKHVCEKCGSDSVFCCATKPGSAPSKGMEEKK
jgi:hypothetical protein